MYQNVLSAIKRIFKHCNHASIANYSAETAEFYFLRTDKIERTSYLYKGLRSYESLNNLQPFIVQDLAKERIGTSDEEIYEQGVRSYIVFPISFEKKLYASLNVSFDVADSINSEVFDLVEEISESLTLVLNQLKLQDELSEKNKDITDSITYANRIQRALYPDSTYLDKLVKTKSIIFRPRDIVSGDFYWMEKIDNSLLFAVGDCTGHGVPGAMLSMLAQSLLNQTVNEKRITEPALILKYLCMSFSHVLKRANVNIKDGFDISIVNIN